MIGQINALSGKRFGTGQFRPSLKAGGSLFDGGVRATDPLQNSYRYLVLSRRRLGLPFRDAAEAGCPIHWLESRRGRQEWPLHVSVPARLALPNHARAWPYPPDSRHRCPVIRAWRRASPAPRGRRICSSLSRSKCRCSSAGILIRLSRLRVSTSARRVATIPIATGTGRARDQRSFTG